MIRFLSSAGILMVRVVGLSACLGGRPLRLIGIPHSLVVYRFV
jgi:hypothetical protein